MYLSDGTIHAPNTGVSDGFGAAYQRGMPTTRRPRRYVSPFTLALVRPALRYSPSRDAYVLRFVGNRAGPVWRPDRRRTHSPYDGRDRRQAVDQRT